MSEGQKWIFIYLCPEFLWHDDHTCWMGVEDEDEARELAEAYGFSWPVPPVPEVSSAVGGLVDLLCIGDEANPAEVVANHIAHLRKLWMDDHPLWSLIKPFLFK